MRPHSNTRNDYMPAFRAVAAIALSPCSVRTVTRMTARALAIVALGAAGACAFVPRPDDVSPAAQFAALERGWADALVRGDVAALDSMLAPSFAVAGAPGDARPPLPRAVWLANVPRFRFDSLGIRDLTATRHGPDSATVQLRLWWQPEFDGVQRPAEENLLEDIWVRRDGRWLVALRRVLVADPSRGR